MPTNGSPPQVRGKPVRCGACARVCGITPADAGKTNPCDFCSGNHWDHPRGCGENRVRLEEHLCGLGSPPRMRGKPLPQTKRLSVARITPADAGKTYTVKPCCRCKQDHPRGCGENQVPHCLAGHFRGSPPRMRGKLALIRK